MYFINFNTKISFKSQKLSSFSPHFPDPYDKMEKETYPFFGTVFTLYLLCQSQWFVTDDGPVILFGKVFLIFKTTCGTFRGAKTLFFRN